MGGKLGPGGATERGWQSQQGGWRGTGEEMEGGGVVRRAGRSNGGFCGVGGAPRTHGCPHALRAHRGAAKEPDTLVQPEPSPPHRMHLSNFFLEPMMRSQPVGTQRPLTQTPPPSAEHGVPSATCGTERRRHGAAPRGGRDRRGGNSPAAAARGKRPGCGTGTSVCSGPPRPRRRTEAPNRPPPAAPPKRRGGCRLRIAPPGTRRGLGGRTGRVRDRGRPGAPRCAPPLGATHRCGRGNPEPCRSGSGVAPRGRSGRR